jgi:hypothetical protein
MEEIDEETGVTVGYLDQCSVADSYDYLLCSYCQTVRSTPFAIYRITSYTPGETFIAIGMSIALETQFKYKIPKILLTAKMDDVPSLISGHKVVEAQNNSERKNNLQVFLPQVLQNVRRTTWKPRPLPFIEVVPRHGGKIAVPPEEQAGRREEVEILTTGSENDSDIGLLEAIEHVPPGSHIFQMYNKVSEIPGVTARLMHVGLLLSEKCMFAAAPAQVKELCEELRKLQINVDAVIQAGQLVLHEEREALLANGNRFDPYFLLSSHQTFISHALREGWQAVRVSIDMSWLTKNMATPEQLLKYEVSCDATFAFQNAPIIALIHYDYSKLMPSLRVEMLKVHPISIVGKYIKRNPFYLNSEQYMLKILRLNKDKGEGAGP